MESAALCENKADEQGSQAKKKAKRVLSPLDEALYEEGGEDVQKFLKLSRKERFDKPLPVPLEDFTFHHSTYSSEFMTMWARVVVDKPSLDNIRELVPSKATYLKLMYKDADVVGLIVWNEKEDVTDIDLEWTDVLAGKINFANAAHQRTVNQLNLTRLNLCRKDLEGIGFTVEEIGEKPSWFGACEFHQGFYALQCEYCAVAKSMV